MKAARFDYAQAADVPGALAALSRPGAKAFSGGQSLGPMLNLRLARPALLVDVAKLADLRRVTESTDGVTYGAAVTHAEFEDGVFPDPTHGILSRIASGIAYRAVRNRGTIGGSLAHADPAADWPTTLAALGARVNLVGPTGQRRLKIEDFLAAPFQTALKDGEIIASVFVPRLSPGAGWGYVKSCRKVGEFAESMCAVLLDAGRSVERLVIGAIEARPLIVADAREVIAAPDKLGALLVDAGFALGSPSFTLHRATAARAIGMAKGATE